MAERTLIENSKELGYKYTIFRPFYIYGIGNNLYREGYIFDRLINDLPIFLPNTGNEIIQFGYIDDLIKAVAFSMDHEKFYNEIFNISGDEAVTMNKYIEICGKVVEKVPVIKYVDLEMKKLKARDWFPFRDVHLFGDISKIKSTGFRNQVNLEEGLKKTYEDLLRRNFIKYPELYEVEKG